jgi:magnesium chelatase family protein
MLATALGATLVGLHAHLVRVEVQATRGPPFFELVGLAEAAVRESRVRVKSALALVGVDINECRVVVNLAPGDVKKAGSGFDLAIAAAVMGAVGAAPRESIMGVLFIGELSLEGTVQPLRGVLPQLLGARSRGVRRAVVSQANAAEAALVDGVDVRTVGSLHDLVSALRGQTDLPVARRAIEVPAATSVVNAKTSPSEDTKASPCDDLTDVRGQGAARRALEIAAAGAHNIAMIGPPGAGKTMLARRLPALLPPLSTEEALEVMAIHSVAGLLSATRGLSLARPFRAPHHTVSEVGLVGGGEGPRPGEVSLAHQGVLFLDELAEFRRSALEALRQPMEDGSVTISRAHAKTSFPSRFLLACALNACPCGRLGDGSGRCECSPDRVRAYRAKMSGPLLDRIDIHVVLPPVEVAALQGPASGESSGAVRARVEAARAIQRDRSTRREVTATTNAALAPRDLDRVAVLCTVSARMLSSAMDRLALSARAYGKVLRVARTIADLEGASAVRPAHVAEAIALRVLDRRVDFVAGANGAGVGPVRGERSSPRAPHPGGSDFDETP